MTAPLVLASASPRRRELLAAVGLPHEVVPSPEPEAPSGRLPPSAHALESALEKARTVARLLPGRLVLGADTVVAVGAGPEDVLGKPADAADAARMLRLLSGRTHEVLTGVALVRSGPCPVEVATVACSRVTFAPLDEVLVRRYVASGEPLDKAGGYAVQGLVATHVTGLDGSWANVVGLPLEALPELFSRAGERLADWQDW